MDIRNIFGKNTSERTDSIPTTIQAVTKKYLRNPYKAPKPTQPSGKVRGFDAAKSNDLTADWYAPNTDINSLLKSQLNVIRGRCRERVRNDDYAKAYIRMFVSNVIGPYGVRLQSLARNFDGTRDDLAIRVIEEQWERWAKYSEFVDISGRQNWKSILETLSRIYATDGEIFLRHIEGSEAGEYGYSVQVLDPELVDVTYNTTLSNGNIIVMGIELNKWLKPVAYHFLTPQDSLSYQGSNGKLYTRIEARHIIHAFKTEFANQVRGIPSLAVSVNRLKQLGGFEEASLVNARASASKMGFFYRQGDEIDPANTIDSDGELIDELSPGSFSLLPDGYRFDSFDSRYPDGEIAPFKKNMLRATAAGLGVDYPTLGQDLESVNLSSARVAINETRELWKSEQQFFIDDIITKVFERWLYQSLFRGKMKISNKPLSIMNIEKYKDVHWLPRRWAFADPTKDSKSAVEMINNRVKAISSVAGELGIDFESEVEIMSRDEELLNKLGLMRIGTASSNDPNEDMEDTAQEAIENQPSNENV